MSVFDELRDMEREMEALTRRMSELDRTNRRVYRRSRTATIASSTNSSTRDGYAIEAQGRHSS